jgi:hypothetical protein
MMDGNLHLKFLLSFAGLSFSLTWPSLANEPVNDSDGKSLIQELERIESAYDGLSFRFTTSANGNALPERIWCISPDGQVARSGWKISSQAKGSQGSVVSRISLLSLSEGWDFNCNFDPSDGPPHEASALSVQFVEPGFRNRAFSPLLLADGHQSISDYIEECTVSHSDSRIESDSYRSLSCVHPTLPDYTYYFDERNRLIYVDRKVSGGEMLSHGKRFEQPRKVPFGTKVNSRCGPIQYETIHGRDLPTQYQEVTRGLGKPHTLQTTISDITPLATDLTSLIEFEGVLVNPGDGRPKNRVHSQGEPTIRYEVHNGKLVKVVDGNAIKMSRTARLRQGGNGFGVARIAVFLFIILGTAFLLWKKGRAVT